MKKTLTIRNISFKDSQFIKSEDAALHATCRLLSRADTVTTQRQSMPSKLTKGGSEKHYTKRLSLKNNHRPSSKRNSESQKQTSENRKIENKGRTRYNKATNDQQEVANITESSSHHFCKVNSLTEPSRKLIVQNKRMGEFIQISKRRIKSEASNTIDLKQELLGRVEKKIELMRKMTIEDEVQVIQPIHFTKPVGKQDTAKLFNFDKLYDYCLRKINRDIKRYERNDDKLKDKKYYELKFQSNVMTKELVQIRKNMVQKFQDGESKNCMGVVGNTVSLAKPKEKSGFKMGKKKMSVAYDKHHRAGESSKALSPDTRGWQVGQKQQYFYLCE